MKSYLGPLLPFLCLSGASDASRLAVEALLVRDIRINLGEAQLTTTSVRLQSGALAVFSPVALTDDVKRKVAELGEVKYIAALDAEVH